MLIRTTSAIDDNAFFLTLGDSCFYLLRGPKSVHLIDSGSGIHVPQLIKRFTELAISPEEITHIYLSNDNPARISGLPLLLRYAKSASVYCSQQLQKRLREEQTVAMLYDANQTIRDLYSSIRFEAVPREEYTDAFRRTRSFPSAETVTIAEDLSIRIIATPGHSEFSTAFFIPELHFLIADQTFGYFRGKEPLAPGADYSIDQSLSSHALVRDLQVDTLAFHSVGIISGALAQRHLADLQEATRSLIKECENASIAGVRHEEIIESLHETVYTSAYKDPLLQWQLDRSVAAIWKQIVGRLPAGG